MRNEDSVVIRLRFGAVEWLLTGDAGPEFEHGFAVDSSEPPLRLLKVGHHGSKSSSSAAFVQTLAPQIALVSAGCANPFGHPAPEVLARLRQECVDRVVVLGDVFYSGKNIGEAVAQTGTRFVDVNSGVERAPGVKDEAKLKAFVVALHHAAVARRESRK